MTSNLAFPPVRFLTGIMPWVRGPVAWLESGKSSTNSRPGQSSVSRLRLRRREALPSEGFQGWRPFPRGPGGIFRVGIVGFHDGILPLARVVPLGALLSYPHSPIISAK